MTGARDVRLVRVPNLRAAHQAIADVSSGADVPADPRHRVVLVSAGSAAGELRRTLNHLTALPLMLSRAELYVELHRRLATSSAPLLANADREAILWHASDAAIASGDRPPFDVRPGLIGEMLALYDGLCRNGRTIDDFERVLMQVLAPGAETDRGAARLLAQTRYLAAVFRGYDRAVDGTGAVDEHRLRARVLATGPSPAIVQVVVTVSDQAGEIDGLWPADFDLLTRLEGLRRIDVVASEGVLDAGYRERLFDLLPGIEERPWDGPRPPAPVLVVPTGPGLPRYHVHRDREEELTSIAWQAGRRLLPASGANIPGNDVTAAERDAGSPAADATSGLDDILVVYDRPLPYVYLARRIFEDAGLAFRTADTLPLAAEPYAAGLDLVFDAALSRLGREPILRLLEAPSLSWRADGRPLSPRDLEVLRTWWQARGVTGGMDGLQSLRGQVGQMAGPHAVRLRRGLEAAIAAATDLAEFDGVQPLPTHLARLAGLLTRRDAARGDAVDHRHARARGAILAILEDLRRAHARYGERAVSFQEVVPLIRRAIEERTFAPAMGERGVRFVDARTARYARADVVCIVGVNEGEWPAPARRSIFYPSGLLRDLGFPRDRDRQPVARAAFHDLVTLAGTATRVSVFQLEDDAIVRPSMLVEDLEEMPIALQPSGAQDPGVPLTAAAALRDGLDVVAGLAPESASWLDLRRARAGAQETRFHGDAGAPPARVLSVTQVERYLDCPFKYFASVELGLEEEDPRDEVGLDPRRRGSLVHRVFQEFFQAWMTAGHGAIAAASLPVARRLFAEVVERVLAGLSEADRLIEGTRLFGSGASPGLGERVFRLEALRPTPVVERLLEFDLRGSYRFGDEDQPTVTIKGIADRIDLLADGSMRLVDYKTGRAPDRDRSVQLAVYAVCAEQKLDGYLGRRWRVGEAAYLALAEKRPWVSVVRDIGDRRALDDAMERFGRALDGIGRGSFPPAPADRRLCTTCAFAAVCRKDYGVDVA